MWITSLTNSVGSITDLRVRAMELDSGILFVQFYFRHSVAITH